MTTTSPSWFPSWPAGFPDLQAIYEQTVPRQFPWGLYEDTTTDEYKDIQALAQVLSWVAQGAEWIKRRVFPQFDDGAMFLHLWEEAFRIPRRATTTLRQNAIIGWMRMLGGNATKQAVQHVMAPIFGVDDPARITFSYAGKADIDTVTTDADAGRAAALNLIHVYDSLETATPDEKQALDAIKLMKPTWQKWGFGRYKDAKYHTAGTNGGRGYNRGCYRSA